MVPGDHRFRDQLPASLPRGLRLIDYVPLS
jgi:hypothetical protein